MAMRIVPLVVPLGLVLPLAVLEGERATEPAIYPRLLEYRIEMPTAVNAFPMTLRVTNAGTLEHNFEIRGQGIEQKLEANLKPGDSRIVQVYLGPGMYTVYCPVADHRELGMTLSLRVGQ
jgi:uncharacterized cupredoxin-like copper-binding protein